MVCVVFACEQDGSTPLYFASDEGHLEVVRCLVEVGHANVDAALPVREITVCGSAAVPAGVEGGGVHRLVWFGLPMRERERLCLLCPN